MMEEQDVIIIGGGAAGVFTAINLGALRPDLNILIIEKTQQLLSKVKVSGGGRCNVTHACFEPRELVKFYPRGEKELLGPFHQFQPGDTINWFAEKGVELKIEEDGRMFPVTDNSQTIIDCFTQELKKNNISIAYQSKVERVEKIDDYFRISTNHKNYKCKYVNITVGGFAKLSSYDFITNLGHTIVPPVPSLFTFNLPQQKINSLPGISCEVEIKLNGTKYTESGPLLITHWGVSGPAVLKLSAQAAKYLNEVNYAFDFSINWLPHFSQEQILEVLSKYKAKQGSKQITNLTNIELPKKLKHYLIERAGISAAKKWAEVNKEELNKLTYTLLNDNYSSKGKTTFKQEFVSCGGIKLSEVNFKTMESKLVPNLYFSGEVLDIDALTGGFNFQNAWTTAWIAAQNMGINSV
jgi:predicted Rossmann fold flavoprotein